MLASHIYNGNLFCKVMKHATKDSIIVYSHREETDRVISAIRFDISTRVCSGALKQTGVKKVNKNECQVPEVVLTNIIKNSVAEINIGNCWR